MSVEVFTQKWAIISLLEEVEEGTEFHYTEFPLHVTLAGVFALEVPGDVIAKEMAELLSAQSYIEVNVKREDKFGPKRDVPVAVLEKGSELMSLYTYVFEWLKARNVQYNSPEYQGKGYVPHVTAQKSASLKLGDKRLLTSVSLIDLFPGGDGYMRKIYKTIDLHDR